MRDDMRWDDLMKQHVEDISTPRRSSITVNQKTPFTLCEDQHERLVDWTAGQHLFSADVSTQLIQTSSLSDLK